MVDILKTTPQFFCEPGVKLGDTKISKYDDGTVSKICSINPRFISNEKTSFFCSQIINNFSLQQKRLQNKKKWNLSPRYKDVKDLMKTFYQQDTLFAATDKKFVVSSEDLQNSKSWQNQIKRGRSHWIQFGPSKKYELINGNGYVVETKLTKISVSNDRSPVNVLPFVDPKKMAYYEKNIHKIKDVFDKLCPNLEIKLSVKSYMSNFNNLTRFEVFNNKNQHIRRPIIVPENWYGLAFTTYMSKRNYKYEAPILFSADVYFSSKVELFIPLNPNIKVKTLINGVFPDLEKLDNLSDEIHSISLENSISEKEIWYELFRIINILENEYYMKTVSLEIDPHLSSDQKYMIYTNVNFNENSEIIVMKRFKQPLQAELCGVKLLSGRDIGQNNDKSKTKKVSIEKYLDGEKVFEASVDENNQLKVEVDKQHDYIKDFTYGYKLVNIIENGEDVPALCKLRIPKHSKIAMGDQSKIRASDVTPIKIWKMTKDKLVDNNYLQATSCIHTKNFIYRVDSDISVPDFNGNLDAVCVPGIHFFFFPHEALTYKSQEFSKIKNIKEVLDYTHDENAE